MTMTVDEYKALCLRYLGRRDWHAETSAADHFQRCRKDYLSGGWSEEDLDVLATLHVLHALQESAGENEGAGDRLFDVWLDLPTRKELKLEVIRKGVIENGLHILESVNEAELDGAALSRHRTDLASARDRALAASLGVFYGSPEYDAWLAKRGERNDG